MSERASTRPPPAPLARTRIAPARAADVPAMTRLLGLLFAQEADFTPRPARQRRALRALLARPGRARLFVARRGDDVVGMLALHLAISTAEGGWAGTLEDLIVRPDCRGAGIGGALLRHAIAMARRRGLTRLTLLTDRANRRAARFYRRFGFMPSAMRPLRLTLHRAS